MRFGSVESKIKSLPCAPILALRIANCILFTVSIASEYNNRTFCDDERLVQ